VEDKMSTFSHRPFEGLKGLLKDEHTASVKEHAPCKDTKGTDNDGELFREAMSGVREIKAYRELPCRPPQRHAIKDQYDPEREAKNILNDIIFGKRAIPLQDTTEYVEWVNPSYRKELPRLLHEGRFSVQDFIDLHGYGVDEANDALGLFLKESMTNRKNCVKIIHGRGLRSREGPVLKSAVTRWLRKEFRKHVIAYVTARACDGGLGAIYVLLR